MSLLKGLSVVSVPVTNWAKAKAFYHDTLGLPILLDIEEAGWCEFGETGKTTFANLGTGPDDAARDENHFVAARPRCRDDGLSGQSR